nr:hypothetical protein [Clostridia bacterium]
MKTIPSLSSLRALAGGEITIEGAVHRIRAMGSFAFLLLRTSHDVFQCVWSPEWCDQDISSLTPEC